LTFIEHSFSEQASAENRLIYSLSSETSFLFVEY